METIVQPYLVKANKDHRCDYCCGAIKKSTRYYKSVHKYDDIYDWKTHQYCADIADKLKMYDDVDEGLGAERFCDNIREEYQQIMSETQNELYESKDFVYPSFQDRLLFVLNHYNISLTNP